ncbi:MAG TPA: HD-GYP domain-containing protein, partial [Gammaproteobacteria bacterium]|nr:HD-GYP domain-containing protein [Gammaproteobacteria bacterium]
ERTDLTGLGWRGRDSFRHDMRKVLASRGKLHRHVQRMLSDVRFGRSADTREARILTLELIDVAMTNPAATLWLTNLETKHDYTVSHCLNVCILSIVFGLHLGLSNDSIAELALGALLHDVGKMRTPVSILDKPGLLTEDEFDIMKKHPVDGFNILRKDKNISEKCLEIVQLHHERISGQGYPFGLKDDEIPVHVRIVAIADVYDDITSNRVYHEGIPPHTCLNMMFHWAPRDFGEDLMQEFIRCIGIYPIGSLVELNSKALGIVMSANPASRLRPIVMLIRDAEGKPYDRRPLINLATPSARGGEPKWSIKRVVDSKEYDIDLGRIAELEAGI